MIAYKFRSSAQLEYVFDIIFNQRLYCSSLEQLNDPNEGVANYVKPVAVAPNPALVQSIKNTIQKYRICSLSEKADDLLLWSHYANGCNGVAVEVEVPDTSNDVRNVSYKSTLPKLNTRRKDIKTEIENVLSTKLSIWSYEREIRIISQNEYYCLATPVRKIIVGHRVPEPTLRALKLVCKSKGITVTSGRVATDKVVTYPKYVFLESVMNLSRY